ncbi:MAG TPA: hypothetical protein PL193_03905 [Xanthobacteraceae bacterium]|nr:hypothetical protein [Xanthobacteraceae bacterium]
MKKLIIGTLAAIAVTASANVASAQSHQDRNWVGMNWGSMQHQHSAQDPVKNFAPEWIK